MPELPEVETTRRLITPYLLGKTLYRIDHHMPKYTDTERATGCTVENIVRRGKYLIVQFDAPVELIVHLGMTGGFRFSEGKHTRAVFVTSESNLYFNDSRKFGKIVGVDAGNYQALPTLAHMGPEPLTDAFDLAEFVRQMQRTPEIKPYLLSQKPVAGLGNIYADEALWQAGIHPQTRGLNAEQAEHLYHAIQQILSRAVEAGGSTLSDNSYQQPTGETGYFQLEHRVYNKTGQPCPRCGIAIEKFWLLSRGTHYCPECQKLDRRNHG